MTGVNHRLPLHKLHELHAEAKAEEINSAASETRQHGDSDSRMRSEAVPAQPADDRGPEPRTTASLQHSCETCQRPLTGRKIRFCSDRCRMHERRATKAGRFSELLTTIEQATTALRQEFLSNEVTNG